MEHDDYFGVGRGPITPVVAPAPRRRKRLRTWLGLILLAAAFGGYNAQRADSLRQAASYGGAHPPAGLEEHGNPLGAPEPLRTTSTHYRFLNLQRDRVTPVTWSPCRPIHYVVRPDNAPPLGTVLLDSAFQQLSRATGLQFVNDGTTTEGPSDARSLYQPTRYGDRWAPVLISWATTAEVPAFEGNVAGHAGPTGIPVAGGDLVYVSGQVAYDAAQFTDLLRGPRGRAAAAVGIMHELGHLVGLDHVKDPAQVMAATGGPTLFGYQPGDLAGLSRLGQGPCRPSV